jgi:hypothetical protein
MDMALAIALVTIDYRKSPKTYRVAFIATPQGEVQL